MFGRWTSSMTTGQKIRVLAVVDTFSRFSPALDPGFSYRAEDVVATQERACATTGYPKTIGVDHGSEFVSRDLDLWAYAKGVTLDFSRPGKPYPPSAPLRQRAVFTWGGFLDHRSR